MADNFKTVTGVVQFDPKEGEAGGKKVRNIAVQSSGLTKAEAVRVSATLWPSHAHVDVKKGSVVTLEGKFNVNKGKKEVEGEEVDVTYFNLSVSRIYVHGQIDEGKKVETANDDAADAPDDDDIPY